MVFELRRSSASGLLLSVSIACCGVPAHAASDDSLELLVVTATRIATPEREVASSLSVLTADAIERTQERTLPDVLKLLPGLNIVQSGSAGGQTSLFMRGTNSNHTKILVDGIDVGDPSSPNGTFDVGQFLTQDIERLEVLRGPQSGLYGSDAIGGVISVTTKRGEGPATGSLSLEGGSFDTFNQSGSLSGSVDRFHYSANVEHFHSGATPVTPSYLLAPGERAIDNDYDNLTGSTKLGFDVTEQLELGLVARYSDTHLRLTGDNFDTFPSTPDSAQSKNDTQQYYTRGTAHAVLFDGALEQTVGVAYSNIKSFNFSPDSGENDQAGNRFKLDWQGNVKLAADQVLVLGAEHQRDEIRQPITASTTINSGYAELQSGFGDTVFDTVSVRYDDNDRFGSKVTYRFAPVYLLKATGTKLKASVGTGFKAPTLDQMFQSFPAFGFFANPNLRPESSLGYDIGVEQSLAGDAVRVGVTYFRNNIKNLISNNADFTSYANVGRAVTDGVESFVTYQPSRSLDLRLDYTFTEASDDVLHQELLRRPKQKIDLGANWRPLERLSLNATVLYVGSWVDGNRDFSISRLDAPGYTTANVAANVDVTRHWALFARVENLFNRHYQNPTGFLQPSVGAFAGIKAKF